MTVLSLFDGMSCGQLALNRAGIPYSAYYASEIDKWAIKKTQDHFPRTVQLGDVRNVKGSRLPKIDLLIGGSPCTGFSRSGNGLNFEHPESKLFFEYVRLLKETEPVYWLLENVKMRKEWEQQISKILSRRPLRLDSGLVSAQLRERLYWTNIPVTDYPKDKKIALCDIIDGADIDYISQCRRVSRVIQVNPSKESGGKQPYQQNRVYDIRGKSPALQAQLSTGSYAIYPGGRRLTVKECCRLQTVPENYFDGIPDKEAFKMLGNGWTVDIIAFILSFMKP